MSIKNEDMLWDSYFYEGTNVLKNKFDIKDNSELKEIEATITYEKLSELSDNPINFTFDSMHLKQLHLFIFGDIYPFAGEYRKVNLIKRFGKFLTITDENTIDLYLKQLFENINNMLNGCNSIQEFSSILSTLYTSLIYCHPFREGNGRTIREFIREFSIIKSSEVGLNPLELNWSLIDKEELNRYVEVAHIFPGGTTMLFLNALVPYDIKTL